MKKTIKFLSLLFLLLISAAFVACDKENSTSSNHKHEYVTTVTQATCTQAGERVKTCAGCDFYESEQIPALGHAFGEWYVTKNATCQEEGEECKSCTVCGFVDTRMLFVTDHSFVDGYCSVCGAIDDEYFTHTWKEADCENPKTCTECGVTIGEALGHTYEDCNQCSVCEYISTEFFNFRYLGNGTYAVSLKDVDNMPSKIVFPSTYKGMPVTVIE